MGTQSSKVSIGLPVYNEQSFIRETLDSILNQTFEDFELIISDNASTNQTEAICQSYVARYKRVRYLRNPENSDHFVAFNLQRELAITDRDELGSIKVG